MLVLIVDDEPAVRYGVASIVRSEGHHVIESGSALDAMSSIASCAVSGNRIHLAILDWDLGTTITGIEVAKHVRALHEGASTILFSGHTMVKMRESWIDPLSGFTAFLAKPVDGDLLRRIIGVAEASFEVTNPDHPRVKK